MCRKETETASQILCECETLAELIFCHLGKHFTEPNNHDKIALCRILYFIGGTILLAEWDRWWCTLDKNMVAVQGLLYVPLHSHSFIYSYIHNIVLHDLPQPKLIAPICSRYAWIRPIQFTSPQFFNPVLTEVLVTYAGRLCRQHSRMWFRIYIQRVKGIWLKAQIPILISYFYKSNLFSQSDFCLYGLYCSVGIWSMPFQLSKSNIILRGSRLRHRWVWLRISVCLTLPAPCTFNSWQK
jgi:hypothetical protein